MTFILNIRDGFTRIGAMISPAVIRVHPPAASDYECAARVQAVLIRGKKIFGFSGQVQ
jgi:hypothetical protein